MANRNVTIKLTELGSDIENISIYKSSFTDANYIASVSRAVLMGDGYTFSVDDQISKFLLFSGEPCNTTLELNLPSPTTTTTTAGTTTTSTTTTTAAPTTTTTTPQPVAGDVSFTVYFNDSLTNASLNNTSSQTIHAQPGTSGLSIASKTITPDTNYVNSSYSVSIGGTNPGSISGPTSVTNSVSGFTLNMPQNGGDATIVVSGNATPVATTTTTSTTTTSTTTTSTTTTLAPISTRFYYTNTNIFTSMASSASPSNTFLYRSGGTSIAVGTQLYTDSALSTQASSNTLGEWIGVETSGNTTFTGWYNGANNITYPSGSGGDQLVKINSTGQIIEKRNSIIYMGLYEGQSCADAFTATTSSPVSNHYLSQGSFATGQVQNYGSGLFNGNYYARFSSGTLEVGQYVASPSGASNGYIQGVSSCPP